MSREVDQRIVEMQFNNAQFESNVKTSMSTLDKLKQSLHLTGASKGFENIDSASKKCNFSGMGNALSNLCSRFNVLDVVGVTAIANITNSAVNAGKRMISALTVDPIKMGFSEYETKINAVQTILANTQSAGKTLEDVTAVLDELNVYADKTIYNFTEMTRNIGTFTAAGVDLDTSAKAIQGIANLAAVSGSNAQQASTAMYQLSQALSSGTVKLQDWNSVVNAGMGGQIFQDALKETARVHGIKVDEIIKKQGSFRESLKEGWISAEILTETLEKFTMTTEGLTEAEIAANRERLKSKGYTDEQIDSIFKLGATATDAATKVKTFTQLWDTLKETAQSGWTQTWEIIIGDFEQAKAFLSEIYETISPLLERSAKDRNDMLSSALGSKWDGLIKKINEAGVSTEEFSDELIVTAREHGVRLTDLIDKYGSLEKAMQHALSSGILKKTVIGETLDKLAKKMKGTGDATEDMKKKMEDYDEIVTRVIRGEFGNMHPRWEALEKQGYNWAIVQNMVNERLDCSVRHAADLSKVTFANAVALRTLSDEQLRNLGYTDEQIKKIRAVSEAYDAADTPEEIARIKELADACDDSSTAVGKLVDQLHKPSGRELMLDTIRNILSGIIGLITAIKDAWGETFTIDEKAGGLYAMLEAINFVSKAFIVNEEKADKLRRTFAGLFALIDIVATFTGGTLKVALKLLCKLLGLVDVDILDATASLGDMLVKLRDWLFANDFVTKSLDKLVEYTKIAYEKIKEWITVFFELPVVQKYVEKFRAEFEKVFGKSKTKFTDFIEGLKDGSITVSDIFNFIRDALNKFINDIAPNMFESGREILNNLIRGMHEEMPKLIEAGKDTIEGYINGIKNGKMTVVDVIFDIGESVINTIKSVLGIHSPSKEMYNVGKFTIEGLIDGIASLANKLISLITSIAGDITGGFGKIDFGPLASIAVSGGMLWLLKKLVDTLGSFAGAFDGIGNVLEGVGAVLFQFSKVVKQSAKVVKQFSKVLGGIKWNLRAKAFQTLAISILILVGAIAVLCLLPTGKVFAAVGAIALLAAVMIALTAAVGKFGPKEGMQFGKFALSLLAMAGSILLVAFAMKMLSGIDGWGLVRAIGGLAAAVIALGFVIAVFGTLVKSRQAAQMGKLASMLIALSISLLLLVKVVKQASKLGQYDLGTAAKVMIGLGLFIAAMILVTKFAGPQLTGLAATLLGISLSLVIMIQVLKSVSKLDPKTLTPGIKVLKKLGILIALLIAVTFFAGPSLKGLGAAMIGISVAMLLMVQVMKQCAKMKTGDFVKGLIAVGILSALIAGLMIITAVAGPSMKGAALTILSLSLAIGLMAGIAVLLGMVKTENLIKGVAAISILTAMMALMLWASRGMASAAGPIIAISAAIAILAGAAAALSMIDPTKLAGSVLALSTLLAMLAVVIATASMLKGGMASLIILTVVIAGLAAMMYMLCQLPIEKTLASAAALSMVLLSLSGACLLLTPVGAAGAVALAGIVVFAALIAAVAGILVLLNGMEANLDKGIEVMGKIGYALGNFVGSIIGGLAAGVTSGLPAIGTHFSDFMKNIQPFLDGISNIPGSALEGAKNLALMILTLTAAEILDGLTSWFTGGSSLDDFAKQLIPFGEAMVEFSGIISGNIDEGAVQAAANAGKMMADMASTLPNSGGVVGWFMGENDMEDFAKQLIPFGEAMVDFSAIVAGNIDEDAVKAAANAGTMMAEMADKLPNSGGVVGWFMGENDMGDFGKELKKFGEGIVGFVQELNKTTIDEGAVQAAANAGSIMVKLANTIPNSGGVVGFFTGNNDIDKFGSKLVSFGGSIVSFSKKVSGNIDVSSVEASANATASLANLCKNAKDYVSGTYDLGSFGTQIATFGQAIVDFSAVVSNSGINEEAVASASRAGMVMAELAKSLPAAGGVIQSFTGTPEDLAAFGYKIAAFGSAMVMFSSVVTGNINEEAVSSASRAGMVMAELAKSLPANVAMPNMFIGNMDLSTFGTQVVAFGRAIVAFSAIVTGRVNSEYVSAAASAGQAMAALANSLPTSGGIISLFSGKQNLTAFGQDLVGFGRALITYSNSVGDINVAQLSSVTKEISNLYAIVKNMSASSGSGLSAFGGQLYKIGNSGVQAFVKPFKDDTKIKDAIITLTGNMLTGVDEACSKFKTKGSELIDKLREGIKAAKKLLMVDVKKLGTDSAKELKTAYESFKSAGDYLVTGFANGIKSSQYKAAARAKAMAEAAIKAAKKALNEHSPSRVFYQIGAFAGEGFINAFDDYSDKSYKAGSEIAASATKGLGRSMRTIQDFLDGEIDTQPTIRPVLDLSNVSTGISAIDGMFGKQPSLSVLSSLGSINRMMNGNQNGGNSDIISAIADLKGAIANSSGNVYSINGITYDDGSNVSNAVKSLIRAAQIERRI